MVNLRLFASLFITVTLATFCGCRTPSQSTRNECPLLTQTEPAVELETPQLHLASYQSTAPDSSSGHAVPAITDGLAVLPAPSHSIQLTLEEAISLGVRRNPDLLAVRASEPVAAAAIRVAETYPYNPQFQTQVLPYARTRTGADQSVSQQHVIVQTFELGGQQKHREGAASASWRQVHNTVHQAELMNKAQTTRLYFTALYQLELRELNQTLTELSEQLTGVIERREKAGQANNADVALAKLQTQALKRQQRLVEANYQTAVLALQTQLKFDSNTPLELAREWKNTRWQPIASVIGLPQMIIGSDGFGPETSSLSNSLDEATLRSLIANRPDVAAARSAVSVAMENLNLADAMRRPNVQVGPLFQTDNSSTEFWGVQAQIDLPVVNTGKPLVQQRCAELRLQRVTSQQLEARAMLEARAALLRYERARRLVEQSHDELAAGTTNAMKPFDDQFNAGQITLLQVFAARSTLAQTRQSYLDLMNEVSLAAADVIQSTGLPPCQLLIPAVESLRVPLAEEPSSGTIADDTMPVLPQP